MTWSAPQLPHILEERLQTARIELMEDQRVAGAANNALAESQAFVSELIEKKLAAAAHAGLDAVEASLRVEASDKLLEAGMELEAVREALAKAGEVFQSPTPFRRSTLAEVALSPLILAGITLCGWMLLIMALWLALRFHPLVLAILAAFGAAPTLAVKKWREQTLAAMRKKMVGELPARICRHYVQVFEEATKSYEASVNALIKNAHPSTEEK